MSSIQPTCKGSAMMLSKLLSCLKPSEVVPMSRVISGPGVACCFGAMSRFYSSGLDVRESAWLYRKVLARMQPPLLR